jgi:site-specific DNA recombinase
VFLLALDLLDQPQELYRQAGPALRKTMNQTIFTKLMLDGAMVATDELAEPFDVIVPAGRAYDDPTYYRERPPALTGVVLHEGVSADDLTLTDRLQLAQGGKGCSKPVMVELRGFEPLTPSMRTQRAHRQSRCCTTFLHVSDVEPGTVTASDRT